MTVYGVFEYYNGQYTDYPDKDMLKLCATEEIAKAYCEIFAKKDEDGMEIKYGKYTLQDYPLQVYDEKDFQYGYGVFDPEHPDYCDTAYIFKPIEVMDTLPEEGEKLK